MNTYHVLSYEEKPIVNEYISADIFIYEKGCILFIKDIDDDNSYPVAIYDANRVHVRQIANLSNNSDTAKN